MTRSLLLSLAVTVAIVAYCGSKPSATADDSKRDPNGQVATRRDMDGGQRAAVAPVAYCGSKPSATADDSKRDPNGQVATRADMDGGQRAAASGSTPHSRMFAGATDTGEIQLNQGRQPYDQIAYARAIRAGRRAMATWPTGPTALSGAILPHSRIVAYYGNPHSKKM